LSSALVERFFVGEIGLLDEKVGPLFEIRAGAVTRVISRPDFRTWCRSTLIVFEAL